MQRQLIWNLPGPILNEAGPDVKYRAQLACSVLSYFLAATFVSAQPQNEPPTTDEIIARMAQARADNRTHFLPYVVTRDYKLFEGGNRDQARSHVIANITVILAESKKYTIEESDGSMLGEKIVRKMLDDEVALAKDSESTDITSGNYDFRLVGEDESNSQQCYELEMVPKRKSKGLIHGTIWVDARSYLPQRVEGEPGTSPSFWARDLHIALRYGYVASLWTQTSSEATASVRILGRYTIISQDVKYQTSGADIAIMVKIDPTN
jgi:hypothetical protein